MVAVGARPKIGAPPRTGASAAAALSLAPCSSPAYWQLPPPLAPLLLPLPPSGMGAPMDAGGPAEAGDRRPPRPPPRPCPVCLVERAVAPLLPLPRERSICGMTERAKKISTLIANCNSKRRQTDGTRGDRAPRRPARRPRPPTKTFPASQQYFEIRRFAGHWKSLPSPKIKNQTRQSTGVDRGSSAAI